MPSSPSIDHSATHLSPQITHTSSIFAPIGVSQSVSSSSNSKAEPTTPQFTSSTPNLSSPETPGQGETPSLNPQTPVAQKRKGAEPVIVRPEDEVVGLGYGDLGSEVKPTVSDFDSTMEMDSVLEVGTSATLSRRNSQTNDIEPEEDTEHASLDRDDLEKMQRRLSGLDQSRSGSGWEQRDEVAAMLQQVLSSVLDRLPLLEEQVGAQRETIAALQHQKHLADQLQTVERDRHHAERVSWRAETRALLRARDAEIAAGTRPKKLLDLDVGYHQELEAANKRLEMDNRLMAPRLADTQKQIDKLVTELRHLRAHVVLSNDPIGASSSKVAIDPALVGVRGRSPIKSLSASTTLGDARAEHLLLAARRVRVARQANPTVGRLSLDELKRGGVIGPEGGLGYAEGYGGTVEEGDEISDSDEDDLLPEYDLEPRGSGSVLKSKRKESTSQGTPLLPRAKRSGKRSLPPATPSRQRARPPQPQTTPGGSTLTDLLRAAEMATRPGTPTPDRNSQIPMSAMSATRSTNRADSRSESPDKRVRELPSNSTPAGWSRARRISGMDLEEKAGSRRVGFPSVGQGEGDESAPESQGSHPDASALDLLAQASQLDEVQTSQEASGPNSQLSSSARFGEMLGPDSHVQQPDVGNSSPKSHTTEGLAPAIDLRSSAGEPVQDHQIDPSLANMPHPSYTQTTAATPRHGRKPSTTSELATPVQRNYFGDEGDFEDTPMQYSAGRDSIGFDQPQQGSFASPTGATVPGLGKYVHLTSNMPARRMRSPYLKWTQEEDELLARAVAMHGEKWDLVSKGVPTRSYHQVRQRWLRKTGAFDKKPPAGEILHGMSGLGKEEYDDLPVSPTQPKKKRKNN